MDQERHEGDHSAMPRGNAVGHLQTDSDNQISQRDPNAAPGTVRTQLSASIFRDLSAFTTTPSGSYSRLQTQAYRKERLLP